jgi:cytochrome c oxidase assembly factor CtaG
VVHRRSSTAWAAAGLAAAVAAVAGPIDELSHRSITGHMGQHLWLILVAAPLLARGAATALPPGRPRSVATGVGGVAVATTAFVVVMTVWHVPVFYDAAVAHDPLHAVEHMTLLGSAALFWLPIVGPSTPAAREHGRSIAPLVAVVVTTVHATAIALVLVVAPRPLYDRPVGAGRHWNGVADQAGAGALLWGVGGAITIGFLAVALAGWLSRLDDDPLAERA